MSDEFREALRVALDRLAFYTSVFLSGEAVGQEVIDEDHDFIREARAALAHPAPLGVLSETEEQK